MLIRHSLLYVVSKVVPGALGMLTTAALTRLLEPAQYGRYGLALVVMTFGASSAFDWLGLAFLRTYQARRGDPLVIGTVVQLFFGVVALTGLLAGLVALLGAFSGDDAVSYAAGIGMMWAYAWFELVSRFEVAEFRPGRFLRMNLSRAVLALAGAVGAAWLTHSPGWTAVGTAAGTLASAVGGGFHAVRFGRARFDHALARSMLLFGLPLAASMAMSATVNSGTRALVQWLGSTEALGLYTASFMLVQNTLAVVAAGIASASYSLAVRAVESGDPAAGRRQLRANGSLLVAVLAPAAVGMSATAHDIATVLVGPEYVAAVTQLTPWMAAGAFFGGIRAHFLDHAFQLGRRPGLQVVVTALAAVIAVGLSLWLIPRLGPLGAAVALTVAMAVSCVHALWAGRYAYAVPLLLDAGWRVAVACGVMVVCVSMVPGVGLAALAARIGIGAAAYGGAGLALDLLGARSRLLTRHVAAPGRLARRTGTGR